MIFNPDHPYAHVRYSPNFGQRNNGKKINSIILHYTGMKSGKDAEDWLCNLESQVSSHYLVHEDGRVVQMVPESARAWHAGRSYWSGETDMNSCSIGIEIVNPGHDLGYRDFPSQQIEAVINLCKGILERWDILPQRVLAHSDIAPSRKIDPGERFPWQRLAQNGIGLYVDPAPIKQGHYLAEGSIGNDVLLNQINLLTYGYEISPTGIYDAKMTTVIKAFQRHFRPAKVDGICDVSTSQTLVDLLGLCDIS